MSFKQTPTATATGLGWLLGAGAGIAAGGLWLLAQTMDRSLPVIWPILMIVGAVLLFSWRLARRQSSFPFFEIGMVYVAVVTLYALYPLIGYLSIGLVYGPFNDNRLYNLQPTPDQIGAVAWLFVAHLGAFMAVYLVVRGRRAQLQPRYSPPGRLILFVLLGLYLAIGVFSLWLDMTFRVSAGTYAESYLVLQSLPAGLAQIAFLVGGARFTVALLMLAALFSHYQRYRWFIAVWLGWLVIASFIQLGSRTELVLLLLAAAMLYHHLVHPIPLMVAGLGALAGVGLFIVLGLLRMGWLFSGVTPGGGTNPFQYASEFEIVFGNAVDLAQRRAGGALGELPAGFFWSDLTISLPRQLLPFVKVMPADWYVTTFYPDYAAQGGGLAFGTIAESVVGGGWPDALVRGATLGLIFAGIHRRAVQRSTSFWEYVPYVWLTTQIYQSVRNTTFFFVYLFLYRYVWVAVGVRLLAGWLRRRSSRAVALNQETPLEERPTSIEYD